MEDMKKLVKEKKVFIGENQTLKNLKLGNVVKVFLASNCTDEAEETVRRYAKMANVEVVKLDAASDELGVTYRKHYAISVMGIKK